jgi:hypothetical protein
MHNAKCQMQKEKWRRRSVPHFAFGIVHFALIIVAAADRQTAATAARVAARSR